MKYLILTLFGLLLLSCDPEIPGESPIKETIRSNTPSQGSSSGKVSGGVYTLKTTDEVEFDNIQNFPFYKEQNSADQKEDYFHIFRFNPDESLDLEIIKKSNSMSFISTYKPTSEWKKMLLLDGNKPYYRYEREYSSTSETIEGNSEVSPLQIIVKGGDVLSMKFNTTIFFKSRQAEKNK